MKKCRFRVIQGGQDKVALSGAYVQVRTLCFQCVLPFLESVLSVVLTERRQS